VAAELNDDAHLLSLNRWVLNYRECNLAEIQQVRRVFYLHDCHAMCRVELGQPGRRIRLDRPFLHVDRPPDVTWQRQHRRGESTPTRVQCGRLAQCKGSPPVVPPCQRSTIRRDLRTLIRRHYWRCDSRVTRRASVRLARGYGLRYPTLGLTEHEIPRRAYLYRPSTPG